MYLYPGRLEVPFNASAYQQPDAQRLNLCFTPTDDFKTLIQGIDEQVIAQLRPRLKELFGELADSMAETTSWYQSPLKISRNNYENVRTKINLDGKRRASLLG